LEYQQRLPFPQDASAISIDPVNPSIVYVGLSSGIYKSINGGASWAASQAGFPGGATINVLAVDPVTPSNVYAATALGVYKSVDAGATWIASNNGLNGGLGAAAPVLSGTNPGSASQDSLLTLSITGIGFTAPFGIDAGNGVTLRSAVLNSPTSITATFGVSPDAALGVRNLVLTASTGSNSIPFTITTAAQSAPVLSGISPASVRQSRSETMTLTGANFTPSLRVDAGNEITVTSLTVVSSTSAAATFSVAPNAALGPRNVRVASVSGGDSNPSTLAVLPGLPTLTGLFPPFVLAGTSTAVRITGTFLSTPLTINTDGDIRVSDVVPAPGGDSVTAIFTVAQNAVLGAHRLGVTAPGGEVTSAGRLTLLVKSRTRQSDFNGDGNADLLWHYPPTGETVMWLMNGTSLLSYASLTQDPDWNVTATGDFNGDGKADLLWYNASTGQTSMWLMDGTTVSSAAILFTDPHWRVTSTGDFNGDGKIDLLWYYAPSGQTSVWWMNGTHILNFFELPANPDFQVTATADFNETFGTSPLRGPFGFADLLGHNAVTGETSAWITQGPGVWIHRILKGDRNWKIAASPDLDGDGNSDLLWFNAATGQTNGTLIGRHAEPTDMPLLADRDWKVTATGDIDGDHKSDLIWHNAATGQTVGWLMDGTAISAWAVLLTAPDWKVTSTGDFNGDGRLDLVWTNDEVGQTVIWLMNGLAPASYSLLLTDPVWRTFSPGR
jgi:hypothetical protein